MQVPSLGREDPLEEGIASHSSILAWRIPMDRGAWRATVHRVAKSWTRLKGLSTHERMRMKVSRGSSPRHKDAWPTRVLGPVEFTGDYKAAGGQGPMPFLPL